MDTEFAYTVRCAIPADASRLCEIEKECFSLPWSEKSLCDFIKNQNTEMLIAEDASGIIGYAGAYLLIDEADIANIAVTSRARRRGVASRLVQELEKALRRRDITSATLEVRQSNSGAISLYTSEGYEQIAIRRGYYLSPREDAIIMKKIL